MKAFTLFVLLFAQSVHATPLSEETAAKLKELRTQIRTWVPLCKDGSFTTDGRIMPDGKENNCPMGDMMEFAGILCLSGEKDRCTDVKNAQDETGRFWRSPGFKTDPNAKYGFSRDQAQGALAYLIATHDTETAQKWMDYISATGDRFCEKGPGTDACEPRAGFWAKARTVWQYLGLPLHKRMTRFKYWVEWVYNPIEVMFEPHDYPMWMSGEGVWFAEELEKRGTHVPNADTHRKIARILNRREPENPFFHYLVHGADEEGAELIMKYCPSEKPSYKTIGPDWIFQRGFNHVHENQTERTWLAPSGWECIFMVNVMVGAEK